MVAKLGLVDAFSVAATELRRPASLLIFRTFMANVFSFVTAVLAIEMSVANLKVVQTFSKWASKGVAFDCDRVMLAFLAGIV